MQFFDTKRAQSALTIFLVAAVALTVVSCDTFSDNSGNPLGDTSESLSISGIQLAPDTTVNEPIRPDTVSPGDRIAIEGQNMNSVVNLYFLGYEASFNAGLAAEETLIASVPNDLPFGELSASALDTLDAIRVENDASEAAYNEVPVLPGPPTIESVSNEHAIPGSEVTITGSALYLIEEIAFPGGATVNEWEAAEDGTSVTLTVPENASTETNGNISITTTAGSDDSAPEIQFHDYRNVFLDIRRGNTIAPTVHDVSQQDDWAYWAALHPYGAEETYTQHAQDFTTGAEGDYIVVQNGDDRAQIDANVSGGWWNSYLSINFNAGTQWVPEGSTNEQANNFAVKFEMSMTGGEWPTGTIRMLMPETNYMARFEPWRNQNAPNSSVSFDGWRTFTIPLSEFAANQGDGNPASLVSEVLGADGVPNEAPSFRLVNDTDGVFPAGLAFAFDHIRVVRIDGFE